MKRYIRTEVDFDARFAFFYDLFCKYCNKLPGKFFIDIDGEKYLACRDLSKLQRFVKSFEKANDVMIHIETTYDSESAVYYVDEVAG